MWSRPIYRTTRRGSENSGYSAEGQEDHARAGGEFCPQRLRMFGIRLDKEQTAAEAEMSDVVELPKRQPRSRSRTVSRRNVSDE